MTAQEKQEIIDALRQEIKEDISKEYKIKFANEDTQSVLSVPRNKWFAREGLMKEVFDNSVLCWTIWETVRKLTCRICGVKYVMELKGDEPSEIAEKLCQTIYDLCKEYTEE